MKKTKVNLKKLVIEFKDLKSLERDLLSATKSKSVKIQPRHLIYFDSLASFRNFMTMQKIEILTLVANEKPKSVYELSKMLGRSIAPVQKDCQMLEAAKFIVMEKEKGGRGTLTPKLPFSYHSILVKLPDHPYELQFKAVA